MATHPFNHEECCRHVHLVELRPLAKRLHHLAAAAAAAQAAQQQGARGQVWQSGHLPRHKQKERSAILEEEDALLTLLNCRWLIRPETRRPPRPPPPPAAAPSLSHSLQSAARCSRGLSQGRSPAAPKMNSERRHSRHSALQPPPAASQMLACSSLNTMLWASPCCFRPCTQKRPYMRDLHASSDQSSMSACWRQVLGEGVGCASCNSPPAPQHRVTPRPRWPSRPATSSVRVPPRWPTPCRLHTGVPQCRRCPPRRLPIARPILTHLPRHRLSPCTAAPAAVCPVRLPC